MEFGPKRGHFLYIFDNFFKDFSLLIIAIIIGLFTRNFDAILENGAILVIVLIQPISRIVEYLTTYYSINGEKLLIKSGFFKKSESEIPLTTITTVDLSQNLLQQIFGVYKINADNVSNISDTNTKINITLKKNDALLVKALLTKGNTHYDTLDTSKAKVIKVPSSEIMLLGLMKSKGVFMVQLITFISATLAMFNLSSADFVVEFGQNGLSLFGAGVFFIVVLVAIFFIASVSGLVGSLIRYYGFEIVDTQTTLRITYGLLTKKHYTIHKSKISGFSYEQSLLMRLMHTGSLQLFAIGYGSSADNEAAEEPMLFPLVNENRLESILSELLPEMEFVSPYHRPQKGTLHYFFFGFGFAMALIFLVATVMASVFIGYNMDKTAWETLWLVGILPMIYSVLGRIQEYRHAAISGNDKNISIVSGGFNKTSVFVKTTHVESVTSKSSLIKVKKNIGHISVNYIAPLGSSMMIAKNISLDVFDSIRAKLIY